MYLYTHRATDIQIDMYIYLDWSCNKSKNRHIWENNQKNKKNLKDMQAHKEQPKNKKEKEIDKQTIHTQIIHILNNWQNME